MNLEKCVLLNMYNYYFSMLMYTFIQIKQLKTSINTFLLFGRLNIEHANNGSATLFL